jgi:integrase
VSLGLDVNTVQEKTLWTMLYETAARSSEVLALDIEDLDWRNLRQLLRGLGTDWLLERSPLRLPESSSANQMTSP